MASTPILYILDFNVGNDNDDPNSPFSAGRITVGSPNSGKLQTLIDHEQQPDGIDVLLSPPSSDTNGSSVPESIQGRIFWTQMGVKGANDGKIQSADLSGKNIQDLYSNGDIHTPKQVIIDRTNKKLYACDREGMRVHRSNLDGSDKEILVRRGDWRNPAHVSDGTRWCVGIAVDPSRGKFYWTQKGPSKGGQGKIFRANLTMPEGCTADDRTDVEMLFQDLPEPIDLEIDVEKQMLYWTDRGDFPKGNTLNCADVSRSAEEIQGNDYKILGRHLHEAIGLKIDDVNHHIYVTDLGGSVYRYYMDGSGRDILFEGQGVYAGIALAHMESKQAQELYGIA